MDASSVLARVVAAAVAVAALAACQPAGDRGSVFDEVNAVRVEYGLAPVVWDDGVGDVAQRWAVHLAGGGEFDHNWRPWDRGLDRRWDLFGEDLARRNPDSPSAVELWLASPSHRAVLLDPRWEAGGAGVAWADGQQYVVLDVVDDSR